MIKRQRTNKGKTYDVGVIDYEKEKNWKGQGALSNARFNNE
jgi:hypothetical protein